GDSRSPAGWTDIDARNIPEEAAAASRLQSPPAGPIIQTASHLRRIRRGKGRTLMTAARWIAALLGLALAAAESPAQGVFIPPPPPYYGYPVGGAFISFGHGRLHGY